jgi:hypothetical protein
VGTAFAEESATVTVSATVEGHSYSSSGDGDSGSRVIPYVSFSGYAYSGAKVYVESDAQSVAVFDSAASGWFSYNVYGISSGIHNFSVYAKDIKGNFSKSVSFLIDVPSSSITNVSNIFVPPTVSVDKVMYGIKEKIVFSGYGVPNAPVYVVVNSFDGALKSFSKQVLSDSSGYFEYVPTADVFGYGGYFVSARSLFGGVFSLFGKEVEFQIMDRISLSATSSKCSQKVDLNKDCKVDILDFFIELKWYKKPLKKAVEKRFDFNGDNKVDLADFSMMAFYWTR